jgi:hypothetical protein
MSLPSSSATAWSPRAWHTNAGARTTERACGVDPRPGFHQPHRVVHGRRAPLQLVERLDLLLRRVRQQPAREDLAERCVVLPPADARERDARGVLLAPRRPAPQPAAHVGAAEDDLLDALGVTARILDGDGPALREREQRELIQAGGVDHRFQVGHERVQVELARIGIRQPAAALVVAKDREAAAQLLEPVAPDRALPVVLEVGQPVRDLDERRSGPVRRVRDPDVVRGDTETDGLLHIRTLLALSAKRQRALRQRE